MPTCEAIIEFFVHVSGEAVAAMFGAFVGAGAAFWLQIGRERKLRDDAQYAAIIEAQHSLLFMWRILASLQFTYLNPQRINPIRHRMLPLYWVTESDISVDLASITFLFRPEMREVVSLCFFAQRGFLSAVEAVKERNSCWTAVTAQPGSVAAIDPTTKMAVVAFDPAKDSMLHSATEALYITTANAMSMIERAFAELRKDALIVFPERHFLKQENLTEAAVQKDLARTNNPKQV